MAEIVSDLNTICFALLITYLQWYNSASLPNEFFNLSQSPSDILAAC